MRAVHSTASTNRRLSFPLAPLSPRLPGINSASRSHCASVNVRRLKAAFLSKTAFNPNPTYAKIFNVHRTWHRR